MIHLTEQFKIVEAITPQAGAAITGDYVSLKNVTMASRARRSRATDT